MLTSKININLNINRKLRQIWWEFLVPTYSTGQTWGALRKAWKAYKIAKVQEDKPRMKEYAQRIRTLQKDLGVAQAKFPDIGIP